MRDDIYICQEGLLHFPWGKAGSYVGMYLFIIRQAKQVHQSDHTDWNVGQTDFSLKCIFQMLSGVV